MVSIDERDMSDEVQYESVTYFDCKECGTHLVLNYYVSEYPTGMLNYEEYDIRLDKSNVNS